MPLDSLILPRAERERFELSIQLPGCRFSKPVPSTTQPTLQYILDFALVPLKTVITVALFCTLGYISL